MPDPRLNGSRYSDISLSLRCCWGLLGFHNTLHIPPVYRSNLPRDSLLYYYFTEHKRHWNGSNVTNVQSDWGCGRSRRPLQTSHLASSSGSDTHRLQFKYLDNCKCVWFMWPLKCESMCKSMKLLCKTGTVFVSSKFCLSCYCVSHYLKPTDLYKGFYSAEPFLSYVFEL